MAVNGGNAEPATPPSGSHPWCQMSPSSLALVPVLATVRVGERFRARAAGAEVTAPLHLGAGCRGRCSRRPRAWGCRRRQRGQVSSVLHGVRGAGREGRRRRVPPSRDAHRASTSTGPPWQPGPGVTVTVDGPPTSPRLLLRGRKGPKAQTRRGRTAPRTRSSPLSRVLRGGEVSVR